MRMTSKVLRGRLATAVIASAATALLVSTLNNGPAPVGGSLPLAGDEMPSGSGAAVDAVASGTGSHWNVLNWAPGVLAAVPSSFSYNTVDSDGRTVKKVMVSTGANADVAAAATVSNMSFSNDGGKTFLSTQQNFPASSHNTARLRDGSLISAQFIPAWVDQSAGTQRLIVQTSKDGTKWTTKAGGNVVNPAGKKIASLRVHRRIMVLPDGTLMVPVYGSFAGDTKGWSAILQSTDEGVTWSFRSFIPATTTTGTNEVGWAYTADDRLLAVLRTASTPNSLMSSFSDDDGKTWSDAQPLLGPDGKQVVGIYPDLVLQPNGTLLLTTGRPDVRVLVSNDGTGRSWQTQDTVFANYPSTGNNGRFDGSSGNNTMENVASNRSILFYDQCHVWGCGAYNEQFGVSAEYVGAVTPGAGRIDVTSQLLDGTASLTGSFAKADKKFPEMRPMGAFDGSSAYGAEARLQGKGKQPGELVLKLDHAYNLNRIGLMLGHGEAQSATVELSTDGTHWSQPVVAAKDRIDRAMKYTDFAAQPAQYVKVSGGDPITTVTELELYDATTDTFENELPYAVPRGWTDATHAWVTDVPDNVAYTDFGGYNSDTSLRLWDKWTDDNARIVRPTDSTQHLQATMQWGGADFRARFTFGTQGTAADGSTVDAWKFRLTQGTTGVLEAFNGSTWVKVGSLSSALPSRTYLPLTINATTDSATVSIGADTFTTSVKAAQVSNLHDIHFSTGDPAEYGGAYQIDDFSVSTDPGATPTLGALKVDPAAVTAGAPFTVASTITNSGDKPAINPVGTLTVGAGWTVTPKQMPTEIPAGATVPVSWTVTAPATTPAGLSTLKATVGYLSAGQWLTGWSLPTDVGIGVQADGALRTFDDETVGQPPAGTQTTGNVKVQDVTVGGQTTRAVEVNDDSASYLSKVIFPQGSAPSRTFAFDMLPKAATQSTIVTIYGTGATTNGLWHLLIGPASATSNDANVSSYNGSAWVSIGKIAGLHDRTAWTHVVIKANTTSATISANGVDLTTSVKASGASAVTSLEVGSSGTGAIGTDTYLDNLQMTAGN